MQRVIELAARLGVNGKKGLPRLDLIHETNMQIYPGRRSLRRAGEFGGLGQSPVIHGRDPASGRSEDRMAIARNWRRPHASLSLADRLEFAPRPSRRQGFARETDAIANRRTPRKLDQFACKKESPIAQIDRRVGLLLENHQHVARFERGPDTATGIWAMADYVEWPQPEGDPRVGLKGYGHYVEEYIREDGQWRIARSRLERLRVDPLT